MKTLIVCYSLSGKTKQLCLTMKRCLDGKLTALSEAKNRSLFGAYLIGSLESRTRKAALTKPLEVDISEYNQIILAGPVWAGFPAPALNGFIRQYDLEDKRLYGFLTYSGSCGKAKEAMEEEMASTKAKVKNVLTMRSDQETMRAVKGGRLSFAFDDEGMLCLMKAVPEEQDD